MMKTNATRRCLCLAALWLLLAVLFSPAVRADDETCTLTVRYPCPGAAFHVFLVAEKSPAGRYTVAQPFDGYAVKWTPDDDPDTADWDAAAETLAAYAARDGVKPAASATVGSDGTAQFTNLQPGLYLLTGDYCEADNRQYTPQNALVSLPEWDAEKGMQYDVAAKPKFTMTETPPETPDTPDTPTTPDTPSNTPPTPATPNTTPATRSVTAVKVWQDGDAADRPQSVTVQLLQNGSPKAEAKLDASNSWRYTWNDLDAAATWQVVEKTVPTGYAVLIAQSGSQYTLTNSRAATPAATVTTPAGSLPQTGQLWWPVPLLAGAGMLLYVYGWLRKRQQ